MSLDKQARIIDGRSHRCENCPLHPCSAIQFKVCSNAFTEGFRKGVKWYREQKRTDNTEIT